MKVAGVKPGDIVSVGDGLPYFAEVIGRERTGLRIAPITEPRSLRWVKSRHVIDHWRKARHCRT